VLVGMRALGRRAVENAEAEALDVEFFSGGEGARGAGEAEVCLWRGEGAGGCCRWGGGGGGDRSGHCVSYLRYMVR
jgi:hypothetical protein